MLGYKIYFNGTQFEIENHLSEVESLPGDHPTSWNAGLDTGMRAVEHRNSRLKTDVLQLKSDHDFVIRTCKECQNYFILVKSETDWFANKKLHIPSRCYTCRKKKNTRL